MESKFLCLFTASTQMVSSIPMCLIPSDTDESKFLSPALISPISSKPLYPIAYLKALLNR